MRNTTGNNPFAISSLKNNRTYVVRDKYKNRWHEADTSLENFSGNNQTAASFLKLDNKLMFAWAIVLFLGLFILVARSFYLQVFFGDHFANIADGNRIRVLDIKSPRGIIYDRFNTELVENIASFSLAIVPVDLPKDNEIRQKIAQETSRISGLTAEEVISRINQQSPYSYQPLILKDNLDHEEAVMVKILSGQYPGLILKTDSARNYIITDHASSFSHILGYTGRIEEGRKQEYLSLGYSYDDMVGKTGVELIYEKELKGVNGREQVEVDAFGEAKEVIASQKPVAGFNIVLSIDAELQKQAEMLLQQGLERHRKDKGVVIAMDPRNGEILALISLPAYNNNDFSGGISRDLFSQLINDPARPMFNRAISGEYPTGSTFKMIVAAAALQEKIITPQTTVMSTGGIYVGRWFFPDWRGGGHGITNVYKALADSVNTFFYIVGGGYGDRFGLGPELLKKYAEFFGMTQRLGIDLPSERPGFFPSKEWKQEIRKEPWYIGDTYNISIGQGDILSTPLQIAAWTSVFANQGTLYRPHVLKEIIDSQGETIKMIDPEIIRKDFVDLEVIKEVNRGLRQAVTDGSARRLSLLPITSAGKTGTAQWSSRHDPHAWFTSFAPFENPEIVVTVLVEEGKEGSTVATPIAYEILAWWAENRFGQ